MCLALPKPTAPAFVQALRPVAPSPAASELSEPLLLAASASGSGSSPAPVPVPLPSADATPPAEHHYQVPNAPALSQLPELPNGCEAVAATMLLNWAGLPVTKEEVADVLPRGEMPAENADGAFVGGNPEDVFVGNPYKAGYGIYHKPMYATMNQLLPGRFRDITGASFDTLLGVIEAGKPAMIWATEHMDTPYLDLEWQDEEDRLVEWYQPEHALLLTGWDEDYAYMNDPMTGQQEAYALSDFKQVWELMGSQAITLN
ncbi:C39 family peptidase [Paenibacillus sp. WC2504]|uniref:C39 family peptidase n=1 Tax=Paenibacillus sp. WC2504 TaxID=3461403 RepID=UPI00404578BF